MSPSQPTRKKSNLQPLRTDSQLVLSRAAGSVTDGPSAGLVLAPVAPRSQEQAWKRITREFSFRDKLDPDWAVMPEKLEGQGAAGCMFMDDPGGMLLETLIQEGGAESNSVERVLRLGILIAGALSKMHASDITHNDIRPANILIDADEQHVWLTGFGFATSSGHFGENFDDLEFGAESLPYMAPEQTGRMNRSADHRSDLYSLGITFYQMLTGKPPFTADDPVELVHSHVARTPVAPSAIHQAIPEPVSAIIMKLLAKPAEDRYRKAEGLVGDLQRCLDLWLENGDIASFPLGETDISDQLKIPEKLYGRDREIDQLVSAADRIRHDDGFEILLIGGYSGVGKSALVGELQKNMASSKAMYADGKFDQYNRHVPYATLAQAFQGLLRPIYGLSDSELKQWREKFLEALGDCGKLLTDLIPSLTLLIGEQTAPPELPPNEAQIRLFSTFQKFLSVWATSEHPLVLFLDDLQWADAGSLKLLEYLSIQGELSHFLLICAYRDNEVGPTHPFAVMVDNIRSRIPIEEISLTPLTGEYLGRMVADTLNCKPDQSETLAQLISDKTGGNPFFTIQFLLQLFDEGLLRQEAGDWVWNADEIADKNITDNVVELMVSRLRRLSAETQKALCLLAYIGNSVSLNKLQFFTELHGTNMDRVFDEALRGSYLIRRKGFILFAHDRIQEAAYSLLPQEDSPAQHLRIGRALAQHLTSAEIEEEIFEMVNHFNFALELMSDPEELAKVRDWNILAGNKAKTAASFATARDYFSQAIELLPEDAWDKDYEDTLWLSLERSGCELLAGNFTRVDELCAELLPRARNKADAGKIYRQRGLRYHIVGNYEAAVDVALEALQQFGLDCPNSVKEINEWVSQTRQEVAEQLKGVSTEAIVNKPAMSDPDALAMSGILADVMPCAFMARHEIYGWLVLNSLSITLRHGNTADSCAAYMGYAIILVTDYNDVDEGFRFSDVALGLQEKLARQDMRGRLLVRRGLFINSRRNSLKSSETMLVEGFLDCQASGDYAYAAYAAIDITWIALESGSPLSEVAHVARKFQDFANKIEHTGLFQALRVLEAFALHQSGEMAEKEFASVREEVCVALTAEKYGNGLVFYHLLEQMLALMAGDVSAAREECINVAPWMKSVDGWMPDTTYHFLAALSLAAPETGTDSSVAGNITEALAGHLGNLHAKADGCPENYEARYLLAAAEAARMNKVPLEAQIDLYERAIQSAGKNGYVHIEALAYERAAQLYFSRKLDLAAVTYLRMARDCYARWGATVQVRRIERDYPALSSGSQSQGLLRDLDSMSVVKASQAVSGEIALDRLIETLLKISIESAGAERGVLVVEREGVPTVVADAHLGEEVVDVDIISKRQDEYDVPTAILNYVQRTSTRILLDDAAQSRDFATDPYLRKTPVKSVLCLPLIKQSRLIGLLYLENRAVSRAFTEERVSVLELLASQAAISLENAQLYETLERHRDNLELMVADKTKELSKQSTRLQQILAEQNVILNNASLGILTIVPAEDGRRVVRRANRAAERLLGYDQGELVGVETKRLFSSQKDYQKVGAAYRELGSGASYSADHGMSRRDGKELLIHLVGSAVNQSDLSKGTIWLLEDITERRAAELALVDAKDLAEYNHTQLAGLLDNSGQGFLSFGPDLRVNSQYSQACVEFFDQAPADHAVDDLLFPGDEEGRNLFRDCVADAFDSGEQLYKQLFLSLAPTQLKIGDRLIEGKYVFLDNAIMAILTDITDTRELADQVARESRRVEMLVNAITDRSQFFSAVADFQAFATGDRAIWKKVPAITLYRQIHTYKGTFNQLGFHHVPAELHQVEAALQPLCDDVDGIRASETFFARDWEGLMKSDLDVVTRALGEDFISSRGAVMMDDAMAVKCEKFASAFLKRAAAQMSDEETEVLEYLSTIRAVSLKDILAGYDSLIRQIASRTDKEILPLEVVGDDIKLDPDLFDSVLVRLGHIFRNAVDHGIEDPDTRIQSGKPEQGLISCSITPQGRGFDLIIKDDGAGIDVGSLEARARARGHAISADIPLSKLISLDGVSSRDTASDISGRGIGMAAVFEAVEKVGGQIDIESEQGNGTAFRLQFSLAG